ncbi:MAG TPA: FHA domain-containing protein [Pseudonocardiaceae bacterium]|jgi:pSer/pThr/pTyr-binding forkhead associated (FHA) protein
MSQADQPGRPSAPVLRIQQGPHAGSTFALPTGITRLGRDADCDVVLDDPTVSGQHAEVDRTSTSVLVRDTRSFNGTYVNGLPCHQMPLTPGDQVWIGRFHLVFDGQPSA